MSIFLRTFAALSNWKTDAKIYKILHIMQENFNHTKERILQYLKYKGVSIRKFSEKISISPSNFNEKNMISSLSGDILSRILTIFEELSPDWLMLGKGEMLRGSDREKPSDTTVSILLQRIEDLARENGSLQAQIDEYKKEIALLQRSASPPAAKTASA